MRTNTETNLTTPSLLHDGFLMISNLLRREARDALNDHDTKVKLIAEKQFNNLSKNLNRNSTNS